MSKNEPPRKALGKGLHSLLPARGQAPTVKEENGNGKVALVPIGQVHPNPNQPRRVFDPVAMMELTMSIERDGIIQPIVVRKTGPQAFEIIAGERRWRAAQSAGLKEIPVIPREADDQKVLELAIIENIQREDLNPIELALGFQRMADELGLSYDEIGEKTSQNRATVANTIRLLQLPPDIQELVATGKISAGHARALLKVENDQIRRTLADRCAREGLSVRMIEELSKGDSPKAPKREKLSHAADANVKAAISELERVLGTRVRISEKSKDKGTIEIEYYSAQDLDRIYSVIVPEA